MGIFNVIIPASLLLTLLLSTHPLFRVSLVRFTFAKTQLDGRHILSLFLIVTCSFFTYQAIRSSQLQWRLRNAWNGAREISPALASDSWRSQCYAEELAALRPKYPLANFQGEVDILPWDIFWVLVNSLHYHPRPVPQSSLVLNDRLARLNADFLAQPAAPDFVLMDAQTANEQYPRYPSMLDNLAWISLLSHYDPVAFSGGYLVLKKSQPVPVTSRDIASEIRFLAATSKCLPMSRVLSGLKSAIHCGCFGSWRPCFLRPQPIVLRWSRPVRCRSFGFPPSSESPASCCPQSFPTQSPSPHCTWVRKAAACLAKYRRSL